jgi:hypothetical protein
MARSQDQGWKVPGYPVLTGEVGEAAIQGKLVYYPQVTRGDRDFPVPQQGMGLISFMLFKEPRKLKSGAPVYGFFKLRGNYSDKDICTSKASEIIRSQDSRNKIRVAEVGAWLPITDEERDGIVQESVDVKDEETEKDKMKAVAIREERAKAERIMKELKDREKEVVNAKDYNDDPESLDFYTMKKVAWQRLRETIEIQKNKTKDLEEKLKLTRGLLASLDEKHPEYATDYIENLNVERRKAGIPDYVPNEEENKIYDATKPTQ